MTSSGDPQNDVHSSEFIRTALLKEFRDKYGDACNHEDVYINLADEYGSEIVAAFIEYVISAEGCDIDTAVMDLGRFFIDCLVEPDSTDLPQFSAADEIICIGGRHLNMTTWENSHIQCFSCQECLDKASHEGWSSEDRVRLLTKALRYEESSEQALYERACFSEELGNYNDAIADLRRYLILVGDIDEKLEAAARIIDCYDHAGLYKDGIRFASEWILLYPQDEYFLMGRARLLCRAGMMDQAMEDLKLLEKLGNGSIEKNLARINDGHIIE